MLFDVAFDVRLGCVEDKGVLITDKAVNIFMYTGEGWMFHLLICLFFYWSSRMVALMLCYHSIVPCTCKDDIRLEVYYI